MMGGDKAKGRRLILCQIVFQPSLLSAPECVPGGRRIRAIGAD
jgi:hypothetical protein